MNTTSPPAKILLQLDTNDQASVFDSVVAVDAGVDQLLRHQAVKPAQVRDLVYGTIFTRGLDQLRHTAIFIGGADVPAGEALLGEVTSTFFGPMRVSVLIDSNGANTTAAAAVLAATRHIPLAGATALVLGGTGPVGQRVVRLLARQQTRVRVGSRSIERASDVCAAVCQQVEDAVLEPRSTAITDELAGALDGADLVIAAGAVGVELLPIEVRRGVPTLQVMIDLNAVPPFGIAGIEVTDRAAAVDGMIGYGAVGVGGIKMKIHKAAVRKLFESNDQVLDAEQVYELGAQLESPS